MFIDPGALISRHFSYHDALHLPRWGRLASESDGLTIQVMSNLQAIFQKMDVVRDFLDVPIFVSVAYRPEKYNELIGGASDSAHLCMHNYAAVDWACSIPCPEVRLRLLPRLEEWGLCMEDNGLGNWVHLDNKPPRQTGRFFKP